MFGWRSFCFHESFFQIQKFLFLHIGGRKTAKGADALDNAAAWEQKKANRSLCFFSFLAPRPEDQLEGRTFQAETFLQLVRQIAPITLRYSTRPVDE